MSDILSSGIDVTLFIQQFRCPLVDGILKIVTTLGEEEFYLLALPLIFWCVDFYLGVRLTCLVLTSHYFNLTIKDLIQEPRPFWFRPDVKLIHAEGYSFPSNHAQTGLVFWLGLAQLMQKRHLWFTGGFLVLLIGFSRIYLGVHFVTDVLAGWILGLMLLISAITVEQIVICRLVTLSPKLQLILAIIGPLLLLAIHPSKEVISVTAALSGAWIGLIVQQQYIPLTGTVPKDEWRKFFLRMLAGTLVLLAIWLGLKIAFPKEGTDYYLFFRYIRYCLSTVWITLGAPWLFEMMNAVPARHLNTIPRTKRTQ